MASGDFVSFLPYGASVGVGVDIDRHGRALTYWTSVVARMEDCSGATRDATGGRPSLRSSFNSQ